MKKYLNAHSTTQLMLVLMLQILNLNALTFLERHLILLEDNLIQGSIAEQYFILQYLYTYFKTHHCTIKNIKLTPDFSSSFHKSWWSPDSLAFDLI